MLNHTYTSVKNANLVDCGKKTHIASQPSPLLKDNFLGEFRTELDKKKVLANLGIATELSLEWEYIKGDIGRNQALIQELDSRTKYISLLDGYLKTLIEGINYLETIVGSEEEVDEEQNLKITTLENKAKELLSSLSELLNYIKDTVDINIEELNTALDNITTKVDNITDLIKVSTKEGNALVLLTSADVEEGTVPGLFVPDLSPLVNESALQITKLQTDVSSIQTSLDDFVTRDELGGVDFDFVNESDFTDFKSQTNSQISNIQQDLTKTVKTGEDGHVDTLFANKLSKDNDEGNIVITDSFEVDSDIPLDIRFVRENLLDLYNLPAKVCYPGMGVIVNSLSALYILRKPAEGVKITQEYIADANNWKCPEDLVTIALSRELYEALEEKNPNVFYYIFEEEIKRTEEPKRDSFSSDEEYNIVFLDWLDSLKILSEEYMSASWGVDIEKKVSEKANKTEVNTLHESITSLLDLIDAINGGEGTTSLNSLADRVSETESDLQYLLGTKSEEGDGEDTEIPNSKGKIAEIEEEIQALDTTVKSDYVTKTSITDENNTDDYIFLKKSEYNKDVDDRALALSEKLETKTVTATKVNISNLPITSNGTDLFVNDKEVALIKDVPKIIYLTQDQYDALTLEDLDPEAYYYTTDEEIYVIKTDFDNKMALVNASLVTVSTTLTLLLSDINGILQLLNALTDKVTALENTPKLDE